VLDRSQLAAARLPITQRQRFFLRPLGAKWSGGRLYKRFTTSEAIPMFTICQHSRMYEVVPIWWYRQISHVDTTYVPARHRMMRSSISPGRTFASGSISDSRMSNSSLCQRDTEGWVLVSHWIVLWQRVVSAAPVCQNYTWTSEIPKAESWYLTGSYFGKK
jgi:hypothetical protein